MAKNDPNADLEAYRSLMERPERFAEGFTYRTVIGAFFVGFIMMPGAIYMGLIAGVSLGSAAEWVTIILFSELARRSFSSLTRQEIYLIYYIAGGLAGVIGGTMLAGGPFGQLMWNQHSGAVAGGRRIWHCRQDTRLGFTHGWVRCHLCLALFYIGPGFPPSPSWLQLKVLSRVEWFTLGYILFRTTSDVERLPFPSGSGCRSGSDGAGRE